MTPEQHYRRAESLLERSELTDARETARDLVAAAHVHAILATAQAPTYAAPLEPFEVSPAPTTGPLEADPCPSVYYDEGRRHVCERPRGHMGIHTATDAAAEVGATVWETREAEPLACAAPDCDRSPGHMGAHERT